MKHLQVVNLFILGIHGGILLGGWYVDPESRSPWLVECEGKPNLLYFIMGNDHFEGFTAVAVNRCQPMMLMNPNPP